MKWSGTWKIFKREEKIKEMEMLKKNQAEILELKKKSAENITNKKEI